MTATIPELLVPHGHHWRRLLSTADEDCTSTDTDYTYVGVGLNCFGSVCINLGTNIIKYSHIVAANQAEMDETTKDFPRDDAESVTSTSGNSNDTPTDFHGDSCARKAKISKGRLRRPNKLTRQLSVKPYFPSQYYWRFGFFLFLVGNVLNFSSFSFAKQSLLAALGSIQFVTNVIFGKTVLKATITNRVMLGTAIIVAGNIAIVLGTGKDGCSPTFTSDELMNLYEETNYIIYMVTIAVTGLIALAVYKTLKRRPLPPMNILGLCFVYSSAAVGTQSVTLFKSLSTMLRDSSSGDNQLDSWFFYVVLVAAIAVAIFWVNRMNLALKKFNALFIIPVLQVCWIMLSSIGGGIYYKEFEAYSDSEVGLYGGSMGLILLGTYLLAPVEPAPRARLDKRKSSESSVDDRLPSDVTILDASKLRNRNGNAATPDGRDKSDSLSSTSRIRTRSRVESGMGMSFPCFHPTDRDAQVELTEWEHEEDHERFAWKERQDLLEDIRDSRKEDNVDIELGTIEELPSKDDDSSSSEGDETPPETPTVGGENSRSPLVLNVL